MKEYGSLLLVTLIASVISCRGEGDRRAPIPPPPPPRAVQQPPEEPGSVMKPMKKVRILVGGCGDACSEPGLAATRFLEATASNTGPEPVVRFLDSTSLVLDGRRLGDRWVEMWKELRPATRKESILETARALGSWTTGLSRDQVDEALTSGLKPIKVWTSEAIYRFEAPGLTWRMVLRPRGLEWLVVELERDGGVKAPLNGS
ncbi:MAG: hypothetical protein GXP54_04170 [Deltaproteobacteria bacterium]|nr:hypothetical protein [Deltaproteobacteria bacterium]